MSLKKTSGTLVQQLVSWAQIAYDYANTGDSLTRQEYLELGAALSAAVEALEGTTPIPMPDDGFERFWAAYPRKVGKDAAAKAFAKRKVDGLTLDAMIEAIAFQQASKAWRDGFVPNPSTWLNQGRWKDEPVLTEARGRIHRAYEHVCHHLPVCGSPYLCQRRQEVEEYKRQQAGA